MTTSNGDTPDDELDEFRGTLAELRQEYMNELPHRLSEIIAQLDTARLNGDYAQLIAQAHQYRGTAGSFRLREVEKVMGRIEDTLAAAAQEAVHDDFLVEIRSNLCDLRTTYLAQATTGEPGI